jgi:hypothetical protein
MPCEHLKELFDLCKKHDLQIAGRDAVKFVCRQCEQQEVCPSSLTDGEQVVTEIGSPSEKSSTEPKTVSGDS